MVKRLWILVLLSSLAISICSCSKTETVSENISTEDENADNNETKAKTILNPKDEIDKTKIKEEFISEKIVIQPTVEKVQGICEMATLECYLHGVTKAVKEAGTGMSHGFEKERQYWVEYACIVELGIDMSSVEMTIEENVITVSLPDVKIVSMDFDISSDDIVMSEDGWLNKNPITSEDQQEIIDKAKEEIEEKIEDDDKLQKRARTRAEELIKNYINQVAAINEVEYVIVFN